MGLVWGFPTGMFVFYPHSCSMFVLYLHSCSMFVIYPHSSLLLLDQLTSKYFADWDLVFPSTEMFAFRLHHYTPHSPHSATVFRLAGVLSSVFSGVLSRRVLSSIFSGVFSSVLSALSCVFPVRRPSLVRYSDCI